MKMDIVETSITIEGIRFAVRCRDGHFFIEEIKLSESDALILAVFILDNLTLKKGEK